MITRWSGIFGKVPDTGDFVVRDLPVHVRQGLDTWMTRHLMPIGAPWPREGVRALVKWRDTIGLLLAVPSRDSVGRRYPLAAAIDAQGLSFEEAELWCNALWPKLNDAAMGVGDLETVLARIQNLKLTRDGEDGEPAVWARGGTPMDPGEGNVIGLLKSESDAASSD